MSRRALWLVALLLGVCVYRPTAWAKRQYEQQLEARVKNVDAIVDIGIELRVVAADVDGLPFRGPHAPRLRVLRTITRGYVIDTVARTIVGPTRDPQVVYCSEDQARIILHDDTLPLGLLVEGSEGSGKTSVQPLWMYFRWLEHLFEGREGGFVAPVTWKLKSFREAFEAMFPAQWFTYSKSDQLITMCDGTRIQMRHAFQRSAKDGSPIQMFNWSWCVADEYQDQIERHSDMEARGRSAKQVTLPDGRTIARYKQLRCGTPKETTAYRDHVQHLRSTGEWEIVTLYGLKSPFVSPQHWERLKSTMPPREYQRRVLVQNPGPERQLYCEFDRKVHVRRLPQIGAVDVTAEVLRATGGQRMLSMLGGHDPGTLFDVTELLRAYRLPLSPEEIKLRQWHEVPLYDWWVVDEVTTEETTTEQHVAKVMERVRGEWRLNLASAHASSAGEVRPELFVRADPYSDSANDAQPHKGVYTTWRKAGVQIMAAAYRTHAEAGPKPAKIAKDARIDVIRRLFLDTAGIRRLYIACDEAGKACAPKLVESLEEMQRDERGKAETQEKDKRDLSHWSAAVGYALYVLEKPRILKAAS